MLNKNFINLNVFTFCNALFANFVLLKMENQNSNLKFLLFIKKERVIILFFSF